LLDVTVNGFSWESVSVEHLCEHVSVLDGLDEDDDLVKLQLVKQIHKFGNFLFVVEQNVVLLQTMECQLGFVFDQDFGRVAHKLTASQLNITREGGGEHHDLFVVRSLLENLLDVTSHACGKTIFRNCGIINTY
jgi:hypothetical protein